jgi:hypothetical protein
MKCFYCGQDWTPDKYYPATCGFCGAPKPPNETIQKYDPFFYDGMIVYALYDPCRNEHQWVFYRGDSFIGKVTADRQFLMSVATPGEDIMPLVLEMLHAK